MEQVRRDAGEMLVRRDMGGRQTKDVEQDRRDAGGEQVRWDTGGKQTKDVEQLRWDMGGMQLCHLKGRHAQTHESNTTHATYSVSIR